MNPRIPEQCYPSLEISQSEKPAVEDHNCLGRCTDSNRQISVTYIVKCMSVGESLYLPSKRLKAALSTESANPKGQSDVEANDVEVKFDKGSEWFGEAEPKRNRSRGPRTENRFPVRFWLTREPWTEPWRTV